LTSLESGRLDISLVTLFRIGLILFTTILTVGQFVFALGGIGNKYGVMLAGRVVFGMGGECMSVAQSAIISAWFKGKELGFALGLNITVARLASVVGGVLIPSLIISDDGLINTTMELGLAICIFSLITGVLLVFVDWYADKKDGKINMIIPDEEKFHWGDLLTFGLPFWLAAFSCMFVYMSVFTYI
jgi:MFS family permease